MHKWILILIGAITASACQRQVQTQKAFNPDHEGRTPSVAAIRSVLAPMNYSPESQGYPFMTTDPGPDLPGWIGEHRSRIQWALDKLPSGFGLQLIGHTCNIGPPAINIVYSTERARKVREAFLAAGLPAARFSSWGRADALADSNGQCPQNSRRVTIQPVLFP